MRTFALLLAVLLLVPFARSLRADDDASPPPAAPPKPAAGPEASKAEIDTLIRDLGSADFETRERASRRLLEIGDPAKRALQKAMDDAPQMEARWRAEQILRRLAREGEQSMDSDAPPAAPGSAPSHDPVPPWSSGGSESLEQRLERLFRHLNEHLGADPFGPLEHNEKLEAPGLSLDVNVFGMISRVTLEVKDLANPTAAPATYQGRTLEEILARNPDLAKAAGMAELQKKWQTWKDANPALFPFEPFFGRDGQRGMSVHVSRGGRRVEIKQDADGVTANITEPDENGRPQTKTYHSTSIEALKKEHPELDEVLGGIDFQLHFGPQVFRDDLRGGIVPRLRSRFGTVERGAFGARLEAVGPVLASQLRLEEGQGALVSRLQPGSPAEALGLELYDIVMRVNGDPVSNVATFSSRLDQLATSGESIELEVIRRGEKTTLRR